MSHDLTRRRLLRAGVAGGVASVAGCATRRSDAGSSGAWPPIDWSPQADDVAADPPVDVRGAIYVPSRAFNLYQMWQYYDPAVVERDLTYATRVNLNAIRTWLCYEVWEQDPEAHERALEHFLDTAADRGLSVLLGLFDGVGGNPLWWKLERTDPRTATGLSSPAREVLADPEQWDGPRRFVDWFMDAHRDDDRLLAIELMNEPGWEPRKTAFARSMFAMAADRRGSVPLTVGATSLANSAEYAQWGSDVHQFHYNFVRDEATFQAMLDRLALLREALDAPVWLTEWQRVRDGRGFTAEPKPGEKTPNYASLAPLVHESGFGSFFWSLMVKPAWVQPQRRNGVVNGLFHEDGAVWSLEDARAIEAMSGSTSFEAEERKRVPGWARV